MIKYICNKCDDLRCETSICPVCNSRTYVDKTEVFYCEKCNIPIFDEICSICNSNGKYMGTDLRPVFPEERLLLECILDKPFEFANKSIWNTSGNNYFVDGKMVSFVIKDIIQNDVDSAQCFKVADRSLTIEKALNLFFVDRRLLVIIITENGTYTEKPIGIVTAADILDMNEVIENY